MIGSDLAVGGQNSNFDKDLIQNPLNLTHDQIQAEGISLNDSGFAIFGLNINEI